MSKTNRMEVALTYSNESSQLGTLNADAEKKSEKTQTTRKNSGLSEILF